MPRALVTGAAGFAGQWLCRTLLEAGWSVTGTTLDTAPDGTVLFEEELRAVQWCVADVRRSADLDRALDEGRPDAVFHLAAVSYVPDAGEDPATACDVNIVAAARLLAGIRERRRAGILDPVVVVVGSAEQYGRHPVEHLPLVETAEQRPLTVYAATKAAQETLALQAWRSEGIRVVVTRSFNHSGPGQAPRFLLPALVNRALGLRGVPDAALPIGNTETVRDYLHVRDVASAYLLLAERGVAGEAYNVCSGRGIRVGELAAAVLQRAGVTARLEVDPGLSRPVEVPVSIGDPSKLRHDTGWAPLLSSTDIIDDLLDASTR